MNSTNAAEFEVYLSQFPNGEFSGLARARLAALQSPARTADAAAGARVGGGARAVSGGRVPAASGRPGVAAAAPSTAGGDARPRSGESFRDCAECPEMVVLSGGRLALGRYEVTVGEYRAFASATGGGAGGGCDAFGDGDSWRNPGFRQTNRHPVTCVSWDDAQEYVSWLSRTTGATYRLPTEAEWNRVVAGTSEGSGCAFDLDRRSTCPVGSYGANGAGLSDVAGNVWEWMADCWEGDCGRRVVLGGFWSPLAPNLRPGVRNRAVVADRVVDGGFRVARTLD